jgi:membrane associated rhomboid family serine protease
MNADQKIIFKSFIPSLLFVSLLWIIKLVEIVGNTSFDNYGVLPRHAEGLIGIITAPLIHANFEHLISNSVPMLILGAILIYFYKEIAMKVFLLVYLLGGFWVWIAGRENYHIGASGVVYGLAAFLFLSGVLRKHSGLMALSFLVVFLYGGLVWGVFPLFKDVSWESHLFGACAGFLCAVVYRKEGPQQKKYLWKPEDDTEKLPYEILVKETEDENNDISNI